MKRILHWKTLLGIIAVVVIYFAYLFAYQAYDHFKKQKYLENLSDTASPNVRVLKDTAYIDYLDSKRTLHVYLPPAYETDSARYPVIYFLDGSALFNDMVLRGPEWQVDEVIDEVVANGGPGAIVIGIEPSHDRNREYKPFAPSEDPEEKEVSGDKHAEWIATDLKAWVDSTYRTKPEAKFTTIGGASLGGLMAYYMVTSYADVFGNAIVLSPSFWVNDKVFDLHQQVDNFDALKIYMNIGAREEGRMIPNARKVYDTLISKGMTEKNLQFDVEPNEGHWHPTWRKGFKKAYPWIVQ